MVYVKRCNRCLPLLIIAAVFSAAAVALIIPGMLIRLFCMISKILPMQHKQSAATIWNYGGLILTIFS